MTKALARHRPRFGGGQGAARARSATAWAGGRTRSSISSSSSLRLTTGASFLSSWTATALSAGRRRVEELWLELKRSSPDADVLVEGRLVLASARAQRGDLDGAIDLLVSAGAARGLRNPAERHIRQWYLLGDLLEASGDIPRAREMFERVV